MGLSRLAQPVTHALLPTNDLGLVTKRDSHFPKSLRREIERDRVLGIEAILGEQRVVLLEPEIKQEPAQEPAVGLHIDTVAQAQTWL
jgi:hypothetical protein